MTLTPEMLKELREKATTASVVPCGNGMLVCPPDIMCALLDRIAELERVAAAVRAITEDVAANGRGADAPYVSQEEAQELMRIIDRTHHA